MYTHLPTISFVYLVCMFASLGLDQRINRKLKLKSPFHTTVVSSEILPQWSQMNRFGGHGGMRSVHSFPPKLRCQAAVSARIPDVKFYSTGYQEIPTCDRINNLHKFGSTGLMLSSISNNVLAVPSRSRKQLQQDKCEVPPFSRICLWGRRRTNWFMALGVQAKVCHNLLTPQEARPVIVWSTVWHK